MPVPHLNIYELFSEAKAVQTAFKLTTVEECNWVLRNAENN